MKLGASRTEFHPPAENMQRQPHNHPATAIAAKLREAAVTNDRRAVDGGARMSGDMVKARL
jgi:hypothetical protein